MDLAKGFKFQPAAFESKSFLVSVSHRELGLPDPTDVESLRDVYARLSMEVEALCLIEQVKSGRVHANQLREQLAPWLPAPPPNQTST